MKSQDVLLLLKLLTLEKLEASEQKRELEVDARHQGSRSYVSDWEGWNDSFSLTVMPEDRYSLRNLEAMTGISKSEIGQSLKRSMKVGLAALDHGAKVPRTNRSALAEFATHGLKYVFPASPGPLVRGIPTSFAAPVMRGKLMTGGDMINVWPDPLGKEKGLAIQPLFKSVPKAVRQDPELYKLLALLDAIRLGNVRERQLAEKMFEKELIR